jgi:uncharacterized protein YgiM (DUF1202 family)
LEKSVSKIRLAVFLLAVMAMVLGASMTVSASTTAKVTKGSNLMEKADGKSRVKVYVPAGTTVIANFNTKSNQYVRIQCTVKGKKYSGWFLSAYLSTKSNTSGNFRSTIQASVFRNGASDSGKFITNIPRGTRVQVLGKTKEGWYKVKYNNKTGYIPPEALDVTKIRVTKGVKNLNTRMHRTPYLGDKNVIDKIPPYKPVAVIRYVTTKSGGKSVSFAYVSYQGKHGYVATSELK